MLNSLSSIMMVSGLVFMGTAPFVADYIVLVVGLVGLLLALVTRDAVFKTWPIRMILLALVLVGVTIPFVYRGEADLLPLAAFSPLLLAPGIAAILARNAEWLSAKTFAMACLVGAIAACLVGLAEFAAVEGARAGAGNNPIHYGGIATMLGFGALIGVVADRSPLRLIFLLGPVAALIAVLLSGSRGPLLAWVALGAIVLPFIAWWHRRDRLMLVALALAVVAAISVVALSPQNRAVTLLGAATSATLSSTAPIDPVVPSAEGAPTELAAEAPVLQALQQQDSARVALLQTAWEAFKSSPIVGIGYGQIMPLFRELNPDAVELHTLENLHSDIGNFAAMSGLLGLLAYALIVLSPLALLWGVKGADSRPLVLGSVMLVVGYGVLGTTNAMFGLLPQTVLFALWLGYLVAYRRALTAD